MTLAALGGRINLFAGLPKDRSRVTFDANVIHSNELVVTATTANTTSDCRAALDLSRPARSAWLPVSRTATSWSKGRRSVWRWGQALKVVLEPVTGGE